MTITPTKCWSEKIPAFIRKAHKSKTLIFGYVLTILGVLWENSELIREFLPTDNAGLVIAAIGLTVNFLRAVTDKPLEDK